MSMMLVTRWCVCVFTAVRSCNGTLGGNYFATGRSNTPREVTQSMGHNERKSCSVPPPIRCKSRTRAGSAWQWETVSEMIPLMSKDLQRAISKRNASETSVPCPYAQGRLWHGHPVADKHVGAAQRVPPARARGSIASTPARAVD